MRLPFDFYHIFLIILSILAYQPVEAGTAAEEAALQKLQNQVFNNTYRILKPLDSGAFGQVWIGENEHTKEQVAIKIEFDANNDIKTQGVTFEVACYEKLNDKVEEGIPIMLDHGILNGYKILVMELLGNSLETLIKKKEPLPKDIIKPIARQMIKRMQYIHSRRYIHRDLKPGNFVFGTGDRSNVLYIIDFGLAEIYWDFGRNEHKPLVQPRSLCGTPLYTSTNVLMKMSQGRRDDMIAVGYIIVELIRGRLPWKNLRGTIADDFHYFTHLKAKFTTSYEILCESYQPCIQYFNNVMTLEFSREPDYQYLTNLFEA